MITTHIEVWTSKAGDACYLEVRNGEVWACWIGQRGNQFRNLEVARKWLVRQGYTPVNKEKK